MLSTLLSTALAATALLQQIDSTLPVERGQRLAVNAFAGEVVVTAWDRNEVRVRGDQVGGRGRVEITRTGASVDVRTHGRRGPAGSVDLQVSVAPHWAADWTRSVCTARNDCATKSWPSATSSPACCGGLW